ncbi:MAG: hypothetical protein AB1941_18350 [Gemmatimonadota bacterium]
MPRSAATKRKLVLSRETVRALSDAKGAGPGFITTKGPSEVYTYCMLDCGTETEYCTVG